MKTSMQYAMEDAVLAKYGATGSALSRFLTEMAEAFKPIFEAIRELGRRMAEAFGSLISSRPPSSALSTGTPLVPRSLVGFSPSVVALPSGPGADGLGARRWKGRR